MKCLVTGAAGFVGSSISDALLAAGHKVTGIDSFVDYYPREQKLTNLRQALANPNFELIEKDLLELDLKKTLYGVEWIFHQAGQAGVRASWGGTFSVYTHNNILATQALLESCKHHTSVVRVVCASSSSVYGNAERFPTLESDLPQPVSPYGVTKLASEHLASLYASQFGVPTVSLRYFTVFGPRQRPDMAFTRLVKAGVHGGSFKLFGDGEQRRDFTYISDVVAANFLAAEKTVQPGSVFNIGRGSPVTMNQVLEILKKLLPNLDIKKEAVQIGDARHTGADISLAREVLGYTPEYSIEDGLIAQIEWCRSLE